jgi:putative transposase
MSDFLSVAATANLLGVSKQAVQKGCKEGKYTTRQVSGKGGLRYEIALTSLPEHAQLAWKKQQADLAIAQLALEPTENTPAKGGNSALTQAAPQRSLSDYRTSQREHDLAIRTVMRWLENYPGSRAKALAALNQGHHDQTLDRPLVYALAHCRQKNSGKATTAAVLTQNTVDKWLARYKKQGDYIPQVREKDCHVKAWHEPALALYLRPQKPSIASIAQALQPSYPDLSYDQLYQFLRHDLSRLDVIKGQNTGMQRREQLYSRRRSHADMAPWDEVHADGWNTHFTAPHPVTGEYVTYEVWDFHDVATRYVPPLSIGLTENTEVIAKGIENAIRDYGVMAILQTDSTKIVKNNKKFSGDPILSLSDLVGFTIVHPKAVGNAHANGIAENWHSWIDKEARVLSTYQAKNMDSLSLRRTQKLTAKLVKARAAGDLDAIADLSKDIAKTSPGLLFETHEQAVEWLEGIRVKWNNKPHSSLKKIKDPATGRQRHQTPQDCLNEFVANGWQAIRIDESQLIDLFRPRKKIKVRLGVVKPYGDMRFRHPDLDHWEGQEVVVAFDIMDYRQVWVSDLKGAAICTAPVDEACRYRSQTAAEAATEKRATAQIRSLEKKIITVEQRAGLDEKDTLESTATRVLDYVSDEPEVMPTRNVFAEVADTEEAKPLTASETWLKYFAADEDDETPVRREINYD